MPHLTVAQLAALGGREFIGEMKNALRDDEAWTTFLDPALETRTRWGLGRIIESIDKQLENVQGDAEWLRRTKALRRFTKARLDRMAPQLVPGSREARAWRAFAARVTRALAEADSTALDTVKTPYGGLTAREWLSVREEKGTDA